MATRRALAVSVFCVVVRCTAKALKLLGLRPGQLPALEPGDDDWYLNLLWFERRWGHALVGGMGMRLMGPDAAKAPHTQPLFQPCFGSGITNCHCCASGGVCCEGGCYRVRIGCPGGGSCWYGCFSGSIYWCCDHRSTQQNKYCICRQYSGPNTGACNQVEGW